MNDIERLLVLPFASRIPRTVLIDAEDVDKVTTFGVWRVNAHGYVCSYVRGTSLRPRYLGMHCLVMGVESDADVEVDHVNGRKLDCRKRNLRVTDHAGNMANQAIVNNRGKSKYRGVVFDRRRQRWVAQQCVNRKNWYIGSYSTEEDAAAAVAAFRVARGLPAGY